MSEFDVKSPRCGVNWPQFGKVCKGEWQCGDCARKEVSELRKRMEVLLSVKKDAEQAANHWYEQCRVKSRALIAAEQKSLA